jgi:hypothetical protein
MNGYTKYELAEMAYNGNLTGIDFSIPQAHHDQLCRLGIDPSFYVMSYKQEDSESRFGKLVNLAEKLINKFGIDKYRELPEGGLG